MYVGEGDLVVFECPSISGRLCLLTLDLLLLLLRFRTLSPNELRGSQLGERPAGALSPLAGGPDLPRTPYQGERALFSRFLLAPCLRCRSRCRLRWRRTPACRSTRSATSRLVRPLVPSLLVVSLTSARPDLSAANKGFFVETCNPAGFTDVDQYCAVGTAELCCGLCPNTSVNGPGQFVWAVISYGCTAFSYTRAIASFGYSARRRRKLTDRCIAVAPDDVWGLAVMQVCRPPFSVLFDPSLTTGKSAGLPRQRFHHCRPHLRWPGCGQDGHDPLSHAIPLAASSRLCVYYCAQYQSTQEVTRKHVQVIAILAPAIFAPQWSRVRRIHGRSVQACGALTI